MLAAHRTIDGRLLAHQAWRAGADWFSGAVLDTPIGGDVVLGQADANLANFLWDGTQVRIVDFEDSGPSNPPGTLERQASRLLLLLDDRG